MDVDSAHFTPHPPYSILALPRIGTEALRSTRVIGGEGLIMTRVYIYLDILCLLLEGWCIPEFQKAPGVKENWWLGIEQAEERFRRRS